MNFLILFFSIQLASSMKDDVLTFRKYENSVVTYSLRDKWLNLTVSGSSVHFFALGDWGGLPYFPYTTNIEHAVSSTMAKLARKYNTQFQLALGDNFYTYGVEDEYDERFKDTFESVFSDKTLQTPWFPLMGNHDHRGNASAQIAYTKHSHRWLLPDYLYSVNVKTDDGNDDLLHILMIDTVVLCGNTESDFHEQSSQRTFHSKLEEEASNKYLKKVEDRIRAISKTSVAYLIVSGHHPVWSVGHHGPSRCLIRKIRPLLHKYRVSAYFCGHDHNLQHVEDTYLGATVEYFLIGSANFNNDSTKNKHRIPKGSLKYFHARNKSDKLNGGFALIQANKNNLTFTFYAATSGNQLYQKVILPRRV